MVKYPCRSLRNPETWALITFSLGFVDEGQRGNAEVEFMQQFRLEDHELSRKRNPFPGTEHLLIEI